MNFALISTPLTANETVAPSQGRAGLPEIGPDGALGWAARKYLAKDAARAAPAPATPAIVTKPCLKIHDEHGFRVIVEAPDSAGLNALRAPIAFLKPTLRRRIGNISSHANATDGEIIEMGRLAGRLFDHIVIHDLPETSGRRQGEISRLMVKGALQTGARPGDIQVIAKERESAFACLRFARSYDLVALLMSDIEEGWQLVRNFKPRWRRPGESDGC